MSREHDFEVGQLVTVVGPKDYYNWMFYLWNDRGKFLFFSDTAVPNPCPPAVVMAAPTSYREQDDYTLTSRQDARPGEHSFAIDTLYVKLLFQGREVFIEAVHCEAVP